MFSYFKLLYNPSKNKEELPSEQLEKITATERFYLNLSAFSRALKENAKQLKMLAVDHTKEAALSGLPYIHEDIDFLTLATQEIHTVFKAASEEKLSARRLEKIQKFLKKNPNKIHIEISCERIIAAFPEKDTRAKAKLFTIKIKNNYMESKTQLGNLVDEEIALQLKETTAPQKLG